MKVTITFEGKGIPTSPRWWSDGVGIAVILRDWRGNVLWEHDDGAVVTSSDAPFTWSYDAPDGVAGARQLAVAVQDLEDAQPAGVEVDGKALGSFGPLSDQWQELRMEVGRPGADEIIHNVLAYVAPGAAAVMVGGLVLATAVNVLRRRSRA